MSLDLGDNPWPAMANQITVTLDSDGAGSAGDAVGFDASDQVTPVSAADDDLVGILPEDSPASAGDDVAVVIFGPVIANATSGLAAGNVSEPEGTNNGRLAANGDGRRRSVDEGGTAVYALAQGNPWCLIAAGGTLPDGTSLGTNEAVVIMK